METITFRQHYNASPGMDKIRAVASNPDLDEAQVFSFDFVICHSGTNSNGVDITAAAQKKAEKEWIGKAILYSDHKEQAPNQIARVYDSWIEERNGVTYTMGRGFGIRTDDLQGIISRIENHIHREMSCGYDLNAAVCNLCQSDIGDNLACPQGHNNRTEGFVRQDVDFSPDHISFVHGPALEFAGLIAAERVSDALTTFSRDGAVLDLRTALHTPVRNDEHYDETMQRLSRIYSLSKDGQTFRNWTTQEFCTWYGRNNPNTTNEATKALTDKLSAEEMISLARIEQERFRQVLPSGKQVSQTKDDETETVPPRTEEEVRQSFRRT